MTFNFLRKPLILIIAFLSFIVIWLIGFFLIHMAASIIAYTFPNLYGFYVMPNALVIIWSLAVVMAAIIGFCDVDLDAKDQIDSYHIP